MQTIDRITIYAVLSFVCICALLFREASEWTAYPIFGLFAALLGIGAEVYGWQGFSENSD